MASRELARELERLLVDPLTIVIDDAEQVADAPEASGVVRDLLTSATPALRVAVAARVALPLRLSKLQAAGRAAQFGPADLAFSPEECAEVLQAANGREADAAELDALWSATEGWPLGVALSAASAGAPAPGALGSTALAGFLEEELLGPLGGELRAALLESSLAPDLDAAMLAALGLPTDLLDEAGLAIQHDSVLRPIDCGGPVVDVDGKVVGLNIARAGRVESYALPSSLVRETVDKLLKMELTSTPTTEQLPGRKTTPQER